MGIEETVSAGFTTSGFVFLFSVTGLLRWFTRVIPTPVVKGIQVGAGLSLVLSAGGSLLQPLGWTTPNAKDNLLWALFAFIALLATQKMQKVPYALLIFILGLVLSLFTAGAHNLPSFRVWHPTTFVPSWAAFKTGALDAGLGQIPLTTLNSVIAVTYLSADLLPNIPAPGVTEIGISVAVMNLIGGWFGAMPVCHGSGGLAAQYRFGARSGASIIFLGLLKLMVGIMFGESLTDLLHRFPLALLSIMIIAAGLELASVGESLNTPRARDLSKEGTNAPHTTSITDEESKQRWTVMLVTAGLLVAFKNDAIGFLAGMCCHWSYRLPRHLATRHPRPSGTGSRSEDSDEHQSLLPR